LRGKGFCFFGETQINRSSNQGEILIRGVEITALMVSTRDKGRGEKKRAGGKGKCLFPQRGEESDILTLGKCRGGGDDRLRKG